MNKFYLVVLAIVAMMTSCEKKENDIDFEFVGSETISPPSTSNTFKNGDIVSFTDVSKVNSIRQINTASTETVLLSNIRDFYFDFKETPATLQFNVSIVNTNGVDWKFCKSENGVWSEIEDATYNDDRAEASFTLDIPSDSQVNASNVFGISIALLKTNSLAYDIKKEHNPTGGVNPFGALLTFKSTVDITPTMTLVGQDDNDIVHAFKSGTTHEISVLGLYNDHDNTVFIDSRTAAGITLRTKHDFTVAYPYFRDKLKVMTKFANGFKNDPDALYFICGNGQNIGDNAVNNSGNNDRGRALSGHDQEKTLIAFDQYGKIRWTYNTGKMTDLMAFPTKYKGENVFFHFKQDYNSYLAISDYNGNELYRTSLSGKLNRPHHDVIMISDNIVAIPETAGADNHVESQIVEFDLTTSTVVKRIDLNKIIDPSRKNILTGWMAENDHIHINSLAYSKEDDCYVISARHQGVIKISRDATDKSGLKWWMTPHVGVGGDYTFSLLTPTNFENVTDNWNLGQHSASILPNGDIMMFDNHNKPNKDATLSDGERASTILVMRVDEDKKEVEQIYEWKTPTNDYSFYMSNALMLPSGNVFSAWATQKKVYETSYPAGEVIFEASFVPSYLRGDTYRAYKINLYK